MQVDEVKKKKKNFFLLQEDSGAKQKICRVKNKWILTEEKQIVYCLTLVTVADVK